MKHRETGSYKFLSSFGLYGLFNPVETCGFGTASPFVPVFLYGVRMPTFCRLPVLVSVLMLMLTAFQTRPAVADAVSSLFQGSGVKPDKVVESLAETFDHVVFGAEIDPNLRQSVVARWQGPIGIALQGRVSERHAAFLQAHLRELSKLTGLRFTQVKPDDPGQKITFAFVKRAEMTSINIPGVDPALVRRLGQGGGCYFLSFKKPASRIVFAIVVVNVERDMAHLNSCLLEEAAQSLGLPNDQDILRPSIFSDRDRVTELAPVDIALIRALYDSRMTAGLSRTKALETARTIFAEMAKKAR